MNGIDLAKGDIILKSKDLDRVLKLLGILDEVVDCDMGVEETTELTKLFISLKKEAEAREK